MTGIRRRLSRISSGPSRGIIRRRSSGFIRRRVRLVLLSCQWLGSLRSASEALSGELLEEAHVSRVEVAYIGDAVEHHGDSIHSHAEGEASDLFGVVGVVGGV